MQALVGERSEDAAAVDTQADDPDAELAIRYRNQAIMLSLQGYFAESESYSREALRIRPDDVDTLNELGVALWRQGRPAEAEATYQQACQIEPNDFRILTNLGLALHSQGRVDEAGGALPQGARAQARRVRSRHEPGNHPLRPGPVRRGDGPPQARLRAAP